MAQLSLFISVALLAYSATAAEKQTYKTCATKALRPSGFAKNEVGPFKVKVEFEGEDYFLSMAGEYGVNNGANKNTKPIDERFDVTRTNAIDTQGRQIFNLNGRTETPVGNLVATVALPVKKGPGFIFIQDVAKSSWQGRLTCDE